MTCAECQGEVNVEMHHGATLRCGCGKTMRDNTTKRAATRDAAALPATHLRLAELLALMRANKALRVKSGDLEVELHPEAFAAAWPAQSSSLGNTEEKTCRCGHSVEVAHNDHGLCLEGCEPDSCAPASGAQ